MKKNSIYYAPWPYNSHVCNFRFIRPPDNKLLLGHQKYFTHTKTSSFCLDLRVLPSPSLSFFSFNSILTSRRVIAPEQILETE